MNDVQWQAFSDFRDAFKAKCAAWNAQYESALIPLQIEAAKKDTPEYPLQTAVVYNRALDDITPDSRITYIVIGDNPGKDEQLAKNNRYLVGQSGKIAQGFFARNPVLQTDFRANVIILNKTPVHTAKTVHLRYLAKQGGAQIQQLITESQVWMAQATAQLHAALYDAAGNGEDAFRPELWLVGYTELKNRGLFIPYREALKAAYAHSEAWQAVRVYRHFSMNQFLIELKKKMAESTYASAPLQTVLADIGLAHRTELFA